MTWDDWRPLCVRKFSFHCLAIVYIFMGLVLQVVNLFMPGGNKRSKKSETNMQLKPADLFKNV